jgi:transcriptional regulator with XRE-family HTH domain
MQHRVTHSSIGAKVKYFRARGGLSQLELELAIGAAQGSISRIESDKVNPTKETLEKISQVLHLSSYELDYLWGLTDKEVTEEEIATAKQYLKEYFSKRTTLSYLVDERSRLWYASGGFLLFLRVKESDAEKVYGTSLIKLLLDPKYRYIEKIDRKNREVVLKNLLPRTFNEMSFLNGDTYYLDALKAIEGDKLASMIWNDVKKMPAKELHAIESRNVVFRIGAFKFDLTYSAEPLNFNRRFRVVEYALNNRNGSK